MTDHAPEELVAEAARVAGIEIPNEDLPSLTAAFANQLQAIAASVLEPVSTFDPRWR